MTEDFIVLKCVERATKFIELFQLATVDCVLAAESVQEEPSEVLVVLQVMLPQKPKCALKMRVQILLVVRRYYAILVATVLTLCPESLFRLKCTVSHVFLNDLLNILAQTSSFMF